MSVTITSFKAPVPNIKRPSERIRTGAEVISTVLDFEIPDEIPVGVVQGKVEVNPTAMTLGRFYPVENKGKRFLVEKVREGVVRIYEIKD